MSRKKRKSYKSSNQKLGQQFGYIPLYSNEDYQKDEEKFNTMITTGQLNDYNVIRRLLLRDMASKIIETGSIGNIPIECADEALRHPRGNWRTLLLVAEQLMRISPHFYRLNMMFSNMVLCDWGIDLCDVKDNANIETLKKNYYNLSFKLETMNLKHEFSKIMKVLPYQDIFCGLLVENSTESFFQQVSVKDCRLYEVQDGLYNFMINLNSINPQKLSAYPAYVQQAYIDYKGNTNDVNNGYIENDDIYYGGWYLPPADKQICLKMNSQWAFPYPMFMPLVRDVLDLDVYKKLKLQSARTDNYKGIMVKVPIDEGTVNKPLLTPEVLSIFAEINRESMNDDIGFIYTLGATGEAISFKDSTNTRNNVSDAIDELYNSSGVTQELFNGSSSATAVTLSVENDSGFIYAVYRQFERWVNRFIKLRNYNKSTYKFYFYMLDITIFNRDTVIKRYKEAGTLGLNVIDKYIAALDITPARYIGAYITHTAIFDYQNRFISLTSTYNSSDSSSVGRPTNAENGELLSEEGERTADTDGNAR